MVNHGVEGQGCGGVDGGHGIKDVNPKKVVVIPCKGFVKPPKLI